MNYWDNGHMSNGWGIVMVVAMLGLFALVALTIAWLIRTTGRTTTPAGGSDGLAARTPEQILAERLARGEIDPDEYRARLEALSAGR